MTRFNYWLCDECGKQLRNAECSPNQLMFTLIANYDTNDDGQHYKAHFCGQACLKKYVDEKVKNHYDLPNIEDGDRSTESETLGEQWEQQEKE